MHRDRIIAKLNPTRRESRDGPERSEWLVDDDERREQPPGKAQRAYGARAREALRQIREIPARGH